jgi:hypothetical protein
LTGGHFEPTLFSIKMFKEILIGGILACAICGCSSLRSSSMATPSEKPTKLEVRNNAASLLSDLLNDEQNVDKVLIVKRASPDVAALVKLIAATAATHVRELDEMASNDPALDLRAIDLPPGEVATRDATAKAEERALLFSGGTNFEFNLLFSQAQAQNYGGQLAAVAAKNSEHPGQVHTFDTISKTMERLDAQVLAAMRALPAN